MTVSGPRRRLDEVRAAFLLLTRLPVGRLADPVPTMGATAWAWPIAGLAIGAIGAMVLCLGHWVALPPLVAATLAVFATTLATGGLHEDGLADMADGIGGGQTRERRLEIMRDSRIGSYGALAIGFSLLVRVGCIAALPVTLAAPGFVALGAASRAVLPAALRLMPPARADGLGRAAMAVSTAAAGVAGIFGVIALGLVGGAAAPIALAVALGALAIGRWAMARLGGQTGDVMGAMQQIAELAGWLTLAALSR